MVGISAEKNLSLGSGRPCLQVCKEFSGASLSYPELTEVIIHVTRKIRIILKKTLHVAARKLPLPASAGSSHKTWRKVGDRGAWNSGTGTPGTKVKKENFCTVCQVRAAVREASLGPEPARGGGQGWRLKFN